MIQLTKTIQYTSWEDEVLDIDENEADYFNDMMHKREYVNSKTNDWKDITTQELIDIYVDFMRVMEKDNSNIFLSLPFDGSSKISRLKNEFKNPLSTMVVDNFMENNSKYLCEIVANYIDSAFEEDANREKVDDISYPIALKVDGKQVVGYKNS